MKTNLITLTFSSLTAIFLQGCIAFPPLVQVEHKESTNNQEILKRLERIDQRLSRLEEKEERH